MFIPPMLARPLPKNGFDLEPGKWAVDEKFDGHRLIVEVCDTSNHLFTNKGVTAWSRYGLKRELPTHLLEVLNDLPNGIYDGELLVPGKRSYGVTELVNGPDLEYFIFDAIQLYDKDILNAPYDERQAMLKQILFPEIENPTCVHLAASTNVNTWDEVIALRDAVWARDGEGLILKRRNAPYQIGKRSKDFIKIKQLQNAVLTVTGFIPSRGLINYRGDYAMVSLLDDEGNTTVVKTRNDAECRKLEERGKLALERKTEHPDIGRRLRIEYQERTPDGNYRHPRWDRWDNE